MRLHAKLARPNVLIKVPATPEGLPAIEQLISEGISVNVTLIFSVEVYAQVAEAYIKGLEKRMAKGGALDRVASVASFFVSRIDTAVDKKLEEIAKAGRSEAAGLIGKAAIANAKLAYAKFQQLFSGARWEKLAAAGARVQRPLWASTGTKNPKYSDVMYIDTLIGPHTVNTMPPVTYDAFRDHGTPQVTITGRSAGSAASVWRTETVGSRFHGRDPGVDRGGREELLGFLQHLDGGDRTAAARGRSRLEAVS